MYSNQNGKSVRRDAKTTKGTENTLKTRTMILIRQYSVIGTNKRLKT